MEGVDGPSPERERTGTGTGPEDRDRNAGWSPWDPLRDLVDHELACGALVKPVDQSVVSDFAYYLVWPERYGRSPEALAFCAWMHEQVGED